MSNELLNSIKPSQEELLGLHGLSSSAAEKWNVSLTTETRSPCVVVRLQGSSDIITPQNTLASSLRAVMASYDNIYSPSTGVTGHIPDTPCFMIGVYKGREQKDDLVLQTLVEEVLANVPPDDYRYPQEGKRTSSDPVTREVYCEFSHWVADAVERCALCGTLNHAGHVSCPRCSLRASTKISQWQTDNVPESYLPKKNFAYFPSDRGTPRLDSDWEKFLEKTDQGEVSPYCPFLHRFSIG